MQKKSKWFYPLMVAMLLIPYLQFLTSVTPVKAVSAETEVTIASGDAGSAKAYYSVDKANKQINWRLEMKKSASESSRSMQFSVENVGDGLGSPENMSVPAGFTAETGQYTGSSSTSEKTAEATFSTKFSQSMVDFQLRVQFKIQEDSDLTNHLSDKKLDMSDKNQRKKSSSRNIQQDKVVTVRTDTARKSGLNEGRAQNPSGSFSTGVGSGELSFYNGWNTGNVSDKNLIITADQAPEFTFRFTQSEENIIQYRLGTSSTWNDIRKVTGSGNKEQSVQMGSDGIPAIPKPEFQFEESRGFSTSTINMSSIQFRILPTGTNWNPFAQQYTDRFTFKYDFSLKVPDSEFGEIAEYNTPQDPTNDNLVLSNKSKLNFELFARLKSTDLNDEAATPFKIPGLLYREQAGAIQNFMNENGPASPIRIGDQGTISDNSYVGIKANVPASVTRGSYEAPITWTLRTNY